MNIQERTMARHLFQNKIFKSDGQSFEDMFISIMSYAEREFQAIKPWGNIGDRKNDGYIKTTGVFYQVYAPEEIQKSYVKTVLKLNEDFVGLKTQWEPVNEYYFVINDKYKGVNADCENALQVLKGKYKLNKSAFLTAKDLENILFSLESDQILSVTGHIPNPADIKRIDFSILQEIIAHIMQTPINKTPETEIVLPDWDLKIQFNDLSSYVADLLNAGYFQMNSLNEYLKNNSNFLSDSLRDKLAAIYKEEKKKQTGDDLFWLMVDRLSPKSEHLYQSIVIIVMAKYFETCDIFEEPPSEGTE